MAKQANIETPYDEYSQSHRGLWRENHLPMLLGFACLVFFIGSGILLYRQNRFVPPRFPDGDSIVSAEGNFEREKLAAIQKQSVLLNVVGAANNRGEMLMAIYDSPESFNDPSKALARLTAVVIDGEAIFLLSQKALPEKFAIAVFHDENGDGVLDKNRLGIPSERYGFSRDARGMVGPPSFEEALMERPEMGAAISISIR